MKKEIENLTQEEVNKIHKKYYKEGIENCCNDCPLYADELFFIYDCKNFKEEIKKIKAALKKKVNVDF